MRPAVALAAVAVALAQIAGCSALGLFSAPYDVLCADDDACAGLTSDPCLLARCDRSARVCEIVDQDADHDGESASACAGVAIELPATDCDDADDLTGASARELCNLRDDDCDGLADDGCVPVAEIALGDDHGCARRGEDVLCWGDPRASGVPRTRALARPRRVDVPPARAIAAGTYGTCALSLDGEVTCWGSATSGPLPPGAPSEPTRVTLPGRVAAIAAGGPLACALLEDGAVWCWGGLASFIGSYSPDGAPTPMLDLAGSTSVVVDSLAMCALDAAGAVSCLGANGLHRVAPTDDPFVFSAWRRDDLPPVSRLVITGVGVLAIGTDGVVWHWGASPIESLGAPTEGHALAVRVDALGHVRDIAGQDALMGGSTVCGADLASATHRCAGTLVRSRTFEHVAFLDGAEQVVIGEEHACARWPEGPVRCWGDNVNGELGDGTYEDRTAPVLVVGL